MPTRSLITVRTSSRGFTLIEIVIVLTIIGVALALAAPRFQPPRLTSDDSTSHVISSARRAAVDRAQTLSLAFGTNGKWTLTEPGLPDRQLLGGAVAVRSSPLYLTISPLGACTLDDFGPPAPVILDPVSCEILDRDTSAR